MGYKSITINAGDSAYLPKNIVLIGTSSTGDAQIISSCLPPPTSGLQCYSFVFPFDGHQDTSGNIMDGVFIKELIAGDTVYPINFQVFIDYATPIKNYLSSVLPKAVCDVLRVDVIYSAQSRQEYKIMVRSFPELANVMQLRMTGIGFPDDFYLNPIPMNCSVVYEPYPWEFGDPPSGLTSGPPSLGQ